MKKNLVIGFSTNQNKSDLLVFCRSLRKIYDPASCDLVIATNHYHPYFDELANEGVQFFSTVSEYVSPPGFMMKAIKKIVLDGYRVADRIGLAKRLPAPARSAYATLLEAWHHPHFTRWLAYRRYMSLNRQYDQVLIADVRDVVFQAPFFDSARDKVALFPELDAYGSDTGLNTSWYRAAYGDKAVREVYGQLPICIGTILGPFDGMLSMVDEIADFFLEHPFGRVEQAAFNWMVLKKLVKTPYDLEENVAGPIATLHGASAKDRTVIKKATICRATDGSVIPVVHMYDRYDDTKNLYDGYLGSAAA